MATGEYPAKPKYALICDLGMQTWASYAIEKSQAGWEAGKNVSLLSGFSEEKIICFFPPEHERFLDLCFEHNCLNGNGIGAIESAISALATKGRKLGVDFLIQGRDIHIEAAKESGMEIPGDDEDVQDINHLLRIIGLIDKANAPRVEGWYKMQLDALMTFAVIAAKIPFRA